MTKVLALDLATCTGWAIDGPGRNARGDVVPLHGSRRAGPAIIGETEYGATYVDFRDWLVDLVSVHKPKYFVYEAPLRFAGGGNTKRGQASPATVRKLLGLCAIAEETAERLSLIHLESDVQTVRKHFCGHGFAKKAAVIATCRMLGWHPEDDNAADALALWDFARAALRLGGSPGTLLGRETTE